MRTVRVVASPQEQDIIKSEAAPYFEASLIPDVLAADASMREYLFKYKVCSPIRVHGDGCTATKDMKIHKFSERTVNP